MNALRYFLRFLSQHRLVSIVVGVIVITAILLARSVAVRSQGLLSPPLDRGSIVQSVYGIGTVMANRSFQIRPGVTSTLRDLFVKEGDTVQRGARLVNIDGIVYRAPFAGTVTYLPYKLGENIFPQSVVLALVDLLDRYLVVSLEQQGALRIRHGQKARMSFDGMRNVAYDGTVQAVYSNGNNFLARIDVSMLPPQVLPGMTADVAISIDEHDNVLLVPVAALEQTKDGMTVWLKRGHRIPKQVVVKVGIVDRDVAEIVSGDLKPGDQVLIRKKSGP